MSVYHAAAATTSASPTMCDEFLRGRADHAKPTYTQLRDEGLSNPAIQLLHEGRDRIAAGHGLYDHAKWCAYLWWSVPLRPEESQPEWPSRRSHVPQTEFAELDPPLDPKWAALARRIDADWDELEARTQAQAQAAEEAS